ncbi:MAG TPA: hypothetical protein VLL97_06080 [Acidobacteriota bacterium]|nr:hypothetical protein [Acidobacteriota bacterium]
MGNALFSKGREGILDRTIDMTGDVRAMLVKSTYVFDDADVFLSDLGAADNGRSAAFGTKTYAAGVFNAANTSLVASAAVACNAIILFQHTGVDGTARLIAYIDTPASGLPCTPAAGQTVNLNWDTGANKIFKL